MTNVDFGRYKRIIQYFWDPEPNTSAGLGSSVWCLGHEYPLSSTSELKESIPNSVDDTTEESFVKIEPRTQVATPPESAKSSVGSGSYEEVSVGNDGDSESWPAPFLDDFGSKIWFTYRSNFPAIARSSDPKASLAMTFSVRLRSHLLEQHGFISDTGWGCMIRSGQSLLANAILFLRLGRGWRRGTAKSDERKILSLFADDPGAPYSIHKFVEHGAAACGKHPGEWFGPSATASCIQALTNSRNPWDLRVYVTGDGSEVYEDRFMTIAKPDGSNFQPTLILVGTRLGIDKITPAYWEALQSTLQMEQSMGIAGGQPSSSHYFIGVQGQHFFYLDPHQTQPALPLPTSVDDYTVADINSCHTRRLRSVHVRDMDPSMLISFLIRDEEDWQSWRQAIEQTPGKPVIRVVNRDPTLLGLGGEREGAISEVESFDDDDDDGDNETVLDA